VAKEADTACSTYEAVLACIADEALKAYDAETACKT